MPLRDDEWRLGARTDLSGTRIHLVKPDPVVAGRYALIDRDGEMSIGIGGHWRDEAVVEIKPYRCTGPRAAARSRTC